MDEPVSKSQKKREADALQKLGVKLVDLNAKQLSTLPLPENLLKAINDAKLIKSHGAKRRQAQLIGKLMRASEFEEIIAAYDQILAEDSAVTASFHEVEQWRERLMSQGKDALTEFIDRYQPEDVQQLRQLIKKAMDDKLKQKNTGASKTLFRYLRSVVL